MSGLPHSRTFSVLCVDDDAGALFIRKALLEQSGYTVFDAPNASEALRIFANTPIDLVVTDNLLPGVSGTEMAVQMKLAKPGIPILLLSGTIEAPGGADQTDKYLSKGEGPAELLHAVADLLRYRRYRISAGAYTAEIACDTRNRSIWHYVIQHEGSSQIICWSQERTEKAAVAAAKRAMDSLIRQRA